MSEVQTRQPASRGRVSARGGRGGYSNRGGRGGNRSSKPDSSEASASAFEDEGEIGQMKKKYASSLPTLKELFPDWTDEDLVFALEDANGDLESAIEHITEGNVSQWGEVKKKTADRSRTKSKDAQSGPTDTISASVRGGRGRGGFEGRGRARGDRGGRGGRGGRAGFTTNETRPATTTAVTTSTATADAWDIAATDANTPAKPEMQPEAETTVATGESNEGLEDSLDDISKTNAVPEPPKKGWASLFAKPAPPPQKKAPAPSAAPVSPPEITELPVEQKYPEPVPVPLPAVPLSTESVSEQPAARAGEQIPSIESVIPPKDDLTKTNLEQIPDESAPAPTATVASTIGSARDIATATPSKPIVPGYPPSAFKQSARGPSFQRRVLEQQEAVVMPGNHGLDRATVQFGSMGLNGDAADLDIDENREDAETRAQPPQHSPAAPRAALPPASQPHLAAEGPAVARPAPGLPPVPQTSVADSSFTDFSRYTDAQKPFDPFSHQVPQPQPVAQEPFANQAPTQPAGTSASDYSPFYAVDQQRLPYNYYGATYGQSQDATAAQRAASGFGASGAEAQQHVPTTQPPNRYGHVEASNSGHNTPNPTLPAATQTPSAQHVPAGGQGAHAGYGYGYPYYSNPHYASYMNQMNQQQQYGRNRPMYDDARRYDEQQQQQQHYMPHSNQYGYANQYGAPYGGKGGMYGQPQHGFSYEHSSSPANASSFNQSVPGRDSVYGRSGSAQPSEAQQVPAGAGAFGTGMSDVFGRSQGGYGQNQPMGQQQPVAAEEAPKSYETPKAGGPSPSLASANRPGSATNSGPGQAQGQPPLQGQQGQQGQQGFGGYPHLNPQYGGGLGGLGGHQGGSSHQGSGYGNYGGAGFGNYYGNSGRGGWGGNYGH